MALQKTEEERERMRQSGAVLSQTLSKVVAAVESGIEIRELDAIGEHHMRSLGGIPSFKGYKSHKDELGFPSTLCISINHELVHAPGNRPIKLREGDIVGLDIGCWVEGMCTDMAVTVPVGRITKEAQKLLSVTRESLYAGVAAACVGNDICDISEAVERHISPHGYGIVRALTGHGVGHEVHESPYVPNYVDMRYTSVPIVDGMCLAIEPMVALGGYAIETADDGFTIVMADGSLSAQFEVTVVISEDGTQIVTPLPEIDLSYAPVGN